MYINKKLVYNNNMEKKIEIDVLDELNKGACMGMDAISFVLEKTEDNNFRELLERQYDGYRKIHDEITSLYPKYSDESARETSTMNKMMTWYGIEMKTMMDKSNSKIAEILLQGTNMGIIEGRKLLNHKNPDEKVNKLVEEYVKNQEEAVEKLKEFL